MPISLLLAAEGQVSTTIQLHVSIYLCHIASCEEAGDIPVVWMDLGRDTCSVLVYFCFCFYSIGFCPVALATGGVPVLPDSSLLA